MRETGSLITTPTAEQQLKFLTNLQRLLAEGQFVATYKYALLLALADIAIESGDNSDKPLTISTKLIAEKFILEGKLTGHSASQGLIQRLVSVHATNIQSIARR